MLIPGFRLPLAPINRIWRLKRRSLLSRRVPRLLPLPPIFTMCPLVLSASPHIAFSRQHHPPIRQTTLSRALQCESAFQRRRNCSSAFSLLSTSA